jgi:hypothetical protein
MPVSVGGIISATNYNNIRSTLSTVYNTTYGQTLRSSPVVATSSKITSQQMLELYLDAQGCHVHQQGSVSTLISVPAAGQTVGANTSQTFNQSTGAKTTPASGATSGVNDYDQLIINISNFNGSASGWPDSSFSVGTATSSARTASWGGNSQIQSIYHVVTFTFSDLANRDLYFNTGAEVRFSTSLTGGSGSKYTDWAGMLAAIGTIKFDKYRLTANSGTTSSIGYDALTSAYQQLYLKAGSGVYTDNDYTIEGRIVNDTVLRFRISLNDGDSNNIDESVSGTVVNNANTFRPDSSFVYDTVSYTAVSVPAPTIATVISMASNNSSAPA